MKKLLPLSLLILLAACEKTELEGITSIKPNNRALGVQCMNSKPIESISAYRNLTFFEGFDDAIPGDSCYTRAPICSTRLDWLNETKCDFDANSPKYAGLKNLNKCTWKVWNGFNFWSVGKTTYKPEAISVDNGSLKLKMLKNPNYDPNGTKCGTKIGGATEWSTNCPVLLGGIDSEYNDASYPGRSFLRGRIELKARYVISNSTGVGYMALWMWPNWAGKGVPYAASNQAMNVEIDIMEANLAEGNNYMFQTLHNWPPGDSNAYIGQGRTVRLTEWHKYGVEWNRDSIKFYVDDCFTHEIKAGDKSLSGRKGVPMVISERASYLMLNISANNLKTVEAADYMEIDEIKLFE